MGNNHLTLLLSPDDVEGFRIFLSNCDPLFFLDNAQQFKLVVQTGDSLISISFGDIYKISEENGFIHVHYKARDVDTGKFVFSKIGPLNKDFLELFLLPFFEKQLFCKKVSMIVGVLCLCLKDSENELGKCFENLRVVNTLKIDCIKKQNYEEASLYRDEFNSAVDEIKNYFRNRLGQDFDEIVGYVLSNCDNLMFIPGLASQEEKRA